MYKEVRLMGQEESKAIGHGVSVVVVDDLMTAGLKKCGTCYNSHHFDKMDCVAACNCCEDGEFYSPLVKK